MKGYYFLDIRPPNRFNLIDFERARRVSNKLNAAVCPRPDGPDDGRSPLSPHFLILNFSIILFVEINGIIKLLDFLLSLFINNSPEAEEPQIRLFTETPLQIQCF